MATIVKQGKKPTIVKKCPKCGTVTEFDSHDVDAEWSAFDAMFIGYHVHCPLCKRNLYLTYNEMRAILYGKDN